MSFEDRFRSMLSDKASKIDTGPEMPSTIKPRYRRRLLIHAVMGLLVISSVTAASFLGIGYLRADRQADVIDNPPQETYECPPDEARPFKEERWTSPMVEIDHGWVEGRPWILCARTVEALLPSNDSDAPKVEKGFCLYWQFDEPKGSGLDCAFNGDEPLSKSAFSFSGAYESANEFLGQPGEENGEPDFYFGGIPSDADSVELHVEGVEPEFGTVYDPDELGVPFKLFIGILEDPPPTRAKVVVRNAQGEEIASRSFASPWKRH